jgi:hypothetical protein
MPSSAGRAEEAVDGSAASSWCTSFCLRLAPFFCDRRPFLGRVPVKTFDGLAGSGGFGCSGGGLGGSSFMVESVLTIRRFVRGRDVFVNDLKGMWRQQR